MSYVASAAGIVDLAAVVLDFGPPLKLLRVLKHEDAPDSLHTHKP